MKNQLLTIVAMLAFAFGSYAQRTCHTMEVLETLMLEDPGLQERMEQIETHTQNAMFNQAEVNNGVITIPVVVHVLYNNSTENVSDAQIMSQMTVLNDDFRRMNADKTNTPSTFSSVASDVEIEFCLATIDPNGGVTTGITRTQTNKTSFNPNDEMKSSASGGTDAWPCGSYLNIWVCDLSLGLLGYAQFPGGPCATDGVVVDYAYFGTIGTATFPFHLGRTATHEVGHWLNLRHIWGDGGCGVDDFVADTPPAGGPNFTGAPCTFPGPNTCNTGVGDLPDMFQNYMDYSDDGCMNLFTTGQKSRMRALFDVGGARASLLSSTACGVPPPPATGLSFDGVDDYVDIGNVPPGDFGTGNFTVELWVKTNQVPGNGQNIALISKRDVCNASNFWNFVMNQNGTLFFEAYNSINGPGYALPVGNINDNQWHHVAAVFNGSSITTYLDGSLSLSGNLSGFDHNNQASLQLGRNACTITPFGDYFEGSMDEVRLWNVARSSQEILNSKDCELSGSETGLTAYYNFDNGLEGGNNTGLTTLTDESSNSNNGTLQNFALTGPTSNWVEGANISGTCVPTPACPITNTFGNIWINSAFKAAGANNPFTYYWGLSNGTITAKPTGGTAPYTYNWYSGAGYTIKNASAKRARLWYPTGPQWVYVDITDATNCTITDSVYINWVDFTCNQPLIWWYQLCDINTNTPLCVQTTGAMRSLVQTGNYVFGNCNNPTRSAFANNNSNTVEMGINVFPNPNNGSFTIAVSNANRSVYDIKVLDMNGRVLFADEFNSSDNYATKELQLDGLAAGMYMIHISDGNSHAVERVVIQ